MEDPLGLRPLKEITLTERIVDPDDVPWVPYTDSIWVKPLRLNRKTGQWTNITKVVGGGQINRHYHVNGVIGFVLEGSWYYVDEDDQVVGFDDVLAHTKTYHDFCRSEGTRPLDLDY